MKQLTLAVGAVMVSVAAAAASLAEARGKIDAVIADPGLMTSTMKSLSPADQRAFIVDVNSAIGKMPASSVDKTVAFVKANRAAILGAAKRNVSPMLAEIFASVPPEALAAVSEVFATELFNRDGNAVKQYSDSDFTRISKDVITKVVNRTQGFGDSTVRNTLAVLMFMRASNGTIPDFVDPLLSVAISDSATRAAAKSEWVPAAMSGDYGPLLAESDASAGDVNAIIRMTGPMEVQAALFDALSSGEVSDIGVSTAMGTLGDVSGLGDNVGASKVERTDDPKKPWNPDANRDEPHPYYNQSSY